MQRILKTSLGVMFAGGLMVTSWAGFENFHAGTVIENYGKVATVKTDEPLPNRVKFKVAFDVADPAKAGEVNRKIDSLARFINMHAEAGVPQKRIHLAMVVHGKATMDFTKTSRYSQTYEGVENANADLIAALSAAGVKFYICGQSAAYYDVSNDDLLPGVNMSLSAMTEHALLQQDGYSLNPF